MIHNTLAASDYGLLDENISRRVPLLGRAPWRRLMGTTVLDAGRLVRQVFMFMHTA